MLISLHIQFGDVSSCTVEECASNFLHRTTAGTISSIPQQSGRICHGAGTFTNISILKPHILYRVGALLRARILIFVIFLVAVMNTDHTPPTTHVPAEEPVIAQRCGQFTIDAIECHCYYCVRFTPYHSKKFLMQSRHLAFINCQ